MASGRPKFIPEEPNTDARSGVTRWFQVIKVPIPADAGGMRQVLGVATEITQRRTLEEQLRQAQKMEAVGRLAGGIAHDFNNLLTAIQGFSALLLRDQTLAAPHRADVQEIADAAARAAALTQQLLAFSRKQVLQPAVLDPNEVVAGMSEMLRRLIGEHIELVTDLGPATGHVLADRSQLEQVIVNLVVNARDAMARGGRLTVETRAVALDVEYARRHMGVVPGPHVLLAVSDTGEGMDAETRTHLFEPFFTTKGVGRGSGLGLATVYGIVQQSGGRIEVYSEPGTGTTFKIYLPRVAAPAHAAQPSGTGAPRGGTETLLVVEDEAAVRRLARQALERLGYRVLEAGDGRQALDVAAAHAGAIDLLVTDVVMPGMGGRELAEHLTGLRPGLRVLYTSGYTESAIVQNGTLDPTVAYVPKPYTPDQLARKVREVLDAPP
jgi:signal transduction histidine kinase